MSVTRSAEFIADLLTQSLGAAVARTRVLEAAKQLRVNEATLSQADAERVLEHLAKEKGLVGSAARFAKVRLALKWDNG